MMTKILLLILITTLIVALLHKNCKNKHDSFSKFINRIWDEWFSEQADAIDSGIFFIVAMIIIILCLT